MNFKRTLSGLKVKYLFYQEVLVWVEGPTDIVPIKKLINGLPCRVESANGIEECQKLAEELIERDLPYVVVCDGHYQILVQSRSPHRRLIFLQRHSIENYFFESDIIEQICVSYVETKGGENTKLEANEVLSASAYSEAIELVEQHLQPLIIYEVADYIVGNNIKVLPDHCNHLLENDGLMAKNKVVNSILKKCEPCFEQRDVQQAVDLIQKFLNKEKRLVDILKGHVVLGIIRRIINKAIYRKTKGKPHPVDNHTLILLLTNIAWDTNAIMGKDHENLKRRIRRAIREAIRLRNR